MNRSSRRGPLSASLHSATSSADVADPAVSLSVMGTLARLVTSQADVITACARRHHGKRVFLFGSVARGTETQESDVDLLVDFDDDASLLDLIQLRNELIDLLGVNVDVLSTGGLKPRDGHILAEAVAL